MARDDLAAHESNYNFHSTGSGQGNWNTGGAFTGSGNFGQGIQSANPRYAVVGTNKAPTAVGAMHPIVQALLNRMTPSRHPTLAPPVMPGTITPAAAPPDPSTLPHQFFNYQHYQEPIGSPYPTSDQFPTAPNGPSYARGSGVLPMNSYPLSSYPSNNPPTFNANFPNINGQPIRAGMGPNLMQWNGNKGAGAAGGGWGGGGGGGW